MQYYSSSGWTTSGWYNIGYGQQYAFKYNTQSNGNDIRLYAGEYRRALRVLQSRRWLAACWGELVGCGCVTCWECGVAV